MFNSVHNAILRLPPEIRNRPSGDVAVIILLAYRYAYFELNPYFRIATF
jgi:hypothetical protein